MKNNQAICTWSDGYNIGADGTYVDFSVQIGDAIAASISDGTYGTEDGTVWNINHMLMASGSGSSFVSNPTKITSIQSNGGTITFSTPDFEVGDVGGITYTGESNFYFHNEGDFGLRYERDHYYSVGVQNDRFEYGAVTFGTGLISTISDISKQTLSEPAKYAVRQTAATIRAEAQGIKAIQAIGTTAKYLGWAGIGLGAYVSYLQISQDPYSMEGYARASVMLGSVAANGIPYVGVGVSLGIGLADYGGAFDGYYSWAGRYRIPH